MENKMSERKRERLISYLLVHIPNNQNNQIWPRLKLGARNSILVSNLGGRSPSIWTIFPCLSKCVSTQPNWKQRN